MADEYYIRCTACGDYTGLMLWWKPDCLGYTTDVRRAGIYTAKEAESICRNRASDRAYPKADVDAALTHAVERDTNLTPMPWTVEVE